MADWTVVVGALESEPSGGVVVVPPEPPLP